jgi:hypothetical protein
MFGYVGTYIILAVALVALVLVVYLWARFGWLWYQRGYFAVISLVWPIVWTIAAPIITLAVWLFWYTHFGER